MTIRDLLKKKDKITDEGASSTAASQSNDDAAPDTAVSPPSPPKFTFMRTTTSTQEIIAPPTHPEDRSLAPASEGSITSPRRNRLSGLHFRKPSRSPAKSTTQDQDNEQPTHHDGTQDRSRRISARLDKFHISPRNRAVSQSSTHVPDDLPDIDGTGKDGDLGEAEWEKRALLLASKNAGEPVGGAGVSTNESSEKGLSEDGTGPRPTRPKHARAVSNPESDLDIQEAIRLHEAGELEKATNLFFRLSSPAGHNNALAQVMYGLSLRHGWGCTQNPAESLKYLSMAASNSAGVESVALSAGSAKGGAAKGELVLAIYELANSFRSGLGCEKDTVAARRYYETAAELGDTDAMTEVAWCYIEGYGGKKDKFKAARYLRMAEKKGVREAGNSWIYKDKYNEVPKTTK